MTQLQFMPPQASTFATQVDYLIWALTGLTVIFTLGVAAMIVFFTIRYHKTRDVNRVMGHGGHTALEIIWTVIPTFLALIIFVWAAVLYYDFRRPPAGAMEIDVIGKQWMWKIQHPNGRREVNTLHIPKDRPVKLRMISQDVLHDFYIPAFRTKMDVLPNRYTYQWFEATKTGEYHLFCAEYCGTEHSRMIGKVYVMEPEAYEHWLNEGNIRMAGGASTPEAAGERLFTKLGCIGCHMAGNNQRGPVLAGIYGTEVELDGGGTANVDEEYIRESILRPMSKVVFGYPRLMPTYKGQVREEDIMSIIAFIKSLPESEG